MVADLRSIHPFWDQQSTDHPWPWLCYPVFNLICCCDTTADSSTELFVQQRGIHNKLRLYFTETDEEGHPDEELVCYWTISALRMFLLFYIMYFIVFNALYVCILLKAYYFQYFPFQFLSLSDFCIFLKIWNKKYFARAIHMLIWNTLWYYINCLFTYAEVLSIVFSRIILSELVFCFCVNSCLCKPVWNEKSWLTWDLSCCVNSYCSRSLSFQTKSVVITAVYKIPFKDNFSMQAVVKSLITCKIIFKKLFDVI